jgi:peptidyl-prolyl cis-trans isomerase SurA
MRPRAKRPRSNASLVLRATMANLGLTSLVLALCLIGIVRPAAAQTDPWPTDPGQSAEPGAPPPGAMPPDASPQSPMPPEPPPVDLPPQTEQSIVVLVNDDPISAYDIEQRERFLVVTAHEKPGPELKKKATDQLIDERLQMQQGKKLDVVPDEDDVTKILTEMAKSNNLTVEGLTNALAQMGINIKTLKDRIRAQLMWRDAVRRKFRHDVQIGDADVDKALSGTGGAGEGSATAGTALQLRQVKFEVPTNADQKTIAQILSEAEALRARFQSCANVADLAKGVKGASVNALSDQVPTAISQPARMLVMNAKVGQMTPPTLSASTIELYAVCGKREVRGDPKQREETEHKLVQEEMEIRAERLLRDMRQDAFIENR